MSTCHVQETDTVKFTKMAGPCKTGYKELARPVFDNHNWVNKNFPAVECN